MTTFKQYMENAMTAHDEIVTQAGAFKRMHGDILTLIATYAKDFRQIINDFEQAFGRTPSADDLLWISSQHHKKDVRYN